MNSLLFGCLSNTTIALIIPEVDYISSTVSILSKGYKKYSTWKKRRYNSRYVNTVCLLTIGGIFGTNIGFLFISSFPFFVLQLIASVKLYWCAGRLMWGLKMAIYLDMRIKTFTLQSNFWKRLIIEYQTHVYHV